MALSKITNNMVSASGIPSGGVIQTAVGTLNGSTTQVADITVYTDTGLSVNITPKFSNSKIYVIATQVVGLAAGVSYARCDYRLLATQDSSDTVIYDTRYLGQNNNSVGVNSIQCSALGLFDVGSTNQCTFHTEMRAANGTNAELGNGTYIDWYTGSKYSIVAMEIAG